LKYDSFLGLSNNDIAVCVANPKDFGIDRSVVTPENHLRLVAGASVIKC
jgi:hypothetical protein